VDKQELQRRTKQFALRIFKLVDALPRTLIAESKLSLLLKEVGELTAILAAGRKSAAANPSTIKHQKSYISS
jgi:hypothetical protein